MEPSPQNVFQLPGAAPDRDPLVDPRAGDVFVGANGRKRTYRGVDEGGRVQYLTDRSRGSTHSDRWNAWLKGATCIERGRRCAPHPFGATSYEGDSTQGTAVFSWGTLKWCRDMRPGSQGCINLSIFVHGYERQVVHAPRGSAPAVAWGFAEGFLAGLDLLEGDRVLIRALAHDKSGNVVLFPGTHPDSWECLEGD